MAVWGHIISDQWTQILWLKNYPSHGHMTKNCLFVQWGELCGNGLRYSGERGGGGHGGFRSTDVSARQEQSLSFLQAADEQEQWGQSGADLSGGWVQVLLLSAPISHQLYLISIFLKWDMIHERTSLKYYKVTLGTIASGGRDIWRISLILVQTLMQLLSCLHHILMAMFNLALRRASQLLKHVFLDG